MRRCDKHQFRDSERFHMANFFRPHIGTGPRNVFSQLVKGGVVDNIFAVCFNNKGAKSNPAFSRYITLGCSRALTTQLSRQPCNHDPDLRRFLFAYVRRCEGISNTTHLGSPLRPRR